MNRHPYVRFRWSHEASLHRTAVRVYNAVMQRVPWSFKYTTGVWLRKGKPPYNLVPGRTVVQVGSPWDTLSAGRSRGAYFSLLAGNEGRVIIIEPDGVSVSAMKQLLRTHGIRNTTIVQSGAWSEATTLQLFIDPLHPATSFTAGVKRLDNARMQEYQVVEMAVDSVDNILERLDVTRVDIVSITTNGAEREILRGMERTLERGVQYISLAETGAVSPELMEKLGYSLFAYDDRGRTYARR